MATSKNELRVRFELPIQEDGFPPIGSETLHGISEGNDLVRLDNTPFFAEGVALGDIVRCSGHPPTIDFVSLHIASGNKSVAVIFLRDDVAEALYQHLRAAGCYCEYGEFPGFDMLAVSVLATVDYGPLRTELMRLEALEQISFAELCIQ